MVKPLGLLYLWSQLPFLALPPAAMLGLIRLLKNNPGVEVPTWLNATCVLLSRPLLSMLERSYRRYRERRAAAEHGAHLVPRVTHGSFDINGFRLMKRLLNNMRDNYPADLIRQWSEEYGPVFSIQTPAEERVFTVEPDYIKAMLATQFEEFHKGPVLYNQLHSLLGEGVFNSDGEMWKFHRSMARPYFSRERISHFDNFEEHAANALTQAETRLSQGYAIDFQDLVARFTLDSATQFLFGYDVQSLSAGIPYPESASHLNSTEFMSHPSNKFVNAFAEGQEMISWRARRGAIWPLAEFWSDGVVPLRKVVDEYVDPLLEEAVRWKGREAHMHDAAKEEFDDTLLGDLVQRTQDIGILKDELINLLVAGRDTTASTLTYAFYMLAEHPEVESRLRREVSETVGPSRRPTYDDIRDMKYLRAFINEVLRLYPAVPLNNRTASKPVVWRSKTPGSKAYYIPEGTRVIYSVFLMHRRTDLWGPDALKFDPDRFLDERVQKYLLPNPYIFLPFNAGPRICLGQQFAYQEISFFLVRLLLRFKNFQLAPDSQPEGCKPPAHWAHGSGRQATEKVWPLLSLTMSVKGGLWVRMESLVAES